MIEQPFSLPPSVSLERIALIGARGSGKTSTARQLAEFLGWRWIDADVALEQKTGRTIQELFQQEGEAEFRRVESSILPELCSLDHVVIATGGGVILMPENRDILRRTSLVVWLQADGETLQKRLLQDSRTSRQRPSLTASGTPTAMEEILAILNQRQPLYEASAHVVVTTRDLTPREVAHAIIEQIQQYHPPMNPTSKTVSE